MSLIIQGYSEIFVELSTLTPIFFFVVLDKVFFWCKVLSSKAELKQRNLFACHQSPSTFTFN